MMVLNSTSLLKLSENLKRKEGNIGDALRDNLLRRKMQQRERRNVEREEESGTGMCCDKGGSKDD